MLNTYEVDIRAQCPVNDEDTDLYHFVIESREMIQVERINGFFHEHAGKKRVFQEELTRLCAVMFGARVTSTGWHSGVRVTCVAP